MSALTGQNTLHSVITDITHDDSILTVSGELHTDKELNEAVVIFDAIHSDYILIEDIVLSHYEQNLYHYSFNINIEEIAKQLHKKMVEDIRTIIMLRVVFEEDETPYLIPVSCKEDLLKPYYTTRRTATTRFFSFRLNNEGFVEFTSQLYLRQVASKVIDRELVAPIISRFSKAKDTVLMGGKTPYDISENTFSLFLSLLKEDGEAYYILAEDHPLFNKLSLAYTDSIVPFKSEAYIDLLFRSEILLTAGLPDLFYPNQNTYFYKALSLEHHILPKAMLGLNSEYYTINQFSPFAHRVDKLLVGSKTEARFAEQELGFKKDDIEIIRLPLQQTLLDKTEENTVNDTLVILPEGPLKTYQTTEQNSLSPFRDLAMDDRIQQFAEDNGLEIVVVVADQLKDFISSKDAVTIASDEDLLDILATAQVVISDYHPFALEFSMTGKPVLFYRPNEKDKIKIRDNHYMQTYENDLPGDITNNITDLIYLLNQFSANDFNLTREQAKKVTLLKSEDPTD